MPKVSRNNVIAGLFVVGAMILAVLISIMVSGATKRLASTNPYIIRFSLADGASGLKAGSPVTLGGQDVGRVTSIAFDSGGGGIGGVDVRVAIHSDLTLHADAWAFLERPLLGSMSSINFSYLGGTKGPTGAIAPVLPPGAVLIGAVAPPSFLAQAGYGPDQVRQVKQMIADASKVVERINGIAERLDKEVDPDLKGIRSAIEDLNAISSEWRARSAKWTTTVDTILTDTSGAVKDFRSLIDENREPIRRSIANLDEAIGRFKTDTMNLADDMIKSAKGGADEFREANARLNRLLKEEEPNIQRILANFRLASDEIKLVGIEVRRSPWRLLYTPKTKELESELFYDAARTYAQAVSDLRAASESLNAVSAGGAVAGEPVEQIKARLQEAFKRYEDAERGLLKKMTDR